MKAATLRSARVISATTPDRAPKTIPILIRGINMLSIANSILPQMSPPDTGGVASPSADGRAGVVRHTEVFGRLDHPGPSCFRRGLSIYLAKNDIQCADHRHHIRDHLPDHHFSKRLQIHKRRWPNAHSIGSGTPIADDVIAQLALRRLNGV